MLIHNHEGITIGDLTETVDSHQHTSGNKRALGPSHECYLLQKTLKRPGPNLVSRYPEQSMGMRDSNSAVSTQATRPTVWKDLIYGHCSARVRAGLPCRSREPNCSFCGTAGPVRLSRLLLRPFKWEVARVSCPQYYAKVHLCGH